ncbi:MAG: hypothetical protein IPM14_00970 [bacterium]|nr:hypothetical protein [bacterium]
MKDFASKILENDPRVNVGYFDYLWNKIYESETLEEKATFVRAMAAYIYFCVPSEIRKFLFHRHIVYQVVNNSRVSDPDELCYLLDSIPDDID